MAHTFGPLHLMQNIRYLEMYSFARLADQSHGEVKSSFST